MKDYRFRVNTRIDEIIMGISYPMLFMIPMLLFVLFLELFTPLKGITYNATKNIKTELLVMIPSVIICVITIPLIKKRLGKVFEIKIHGNTIDVNTDKRSYSIGELDKLSVIDRKGFILVRIKGSMGRLDFLEREGRNLFGLSSEEDINEIREMIKYLRTLI